MRWSAAFEEMLMAFGSTASWACWSAAVELDPSSLIRRARAVEPSGSRRQAQMELARHAWDAPERTDDAVGIDGACAARAGRVRGLAECGGVRKARTMVADSRGYVPCFHSP